MFYLETHITNHCNLNCAYCTHYAPLAEPWYKDINEYIREISRLSLLARSTLQEFRILGGEPLLHPDVIEFLYITRKALPYSRIELVTNGLLIPKMSKRFFEVLNDCRISIYISDYGVMPNSVKETIQREVRLYRIEPKRHFVKPLLDLHGSDKNRNFQECKESFDSVCYNLRNGYIFHCPTEAYFDFFCKYFNISPDFNVYSNGINIFESTLEEIDKYLNTPSDFCKYCQMKNKPTVNYALSQKKASEWLA